MVLRVHDLLRDILQHWNYFLVDLPYHQAQHLTQDDHPKLEVRASLEDEGQDDALECWQEALH